MIGLKEKYTKEVIPAMKAKFGYKNNLAIPKIDKVVLNAGISSSKSEQSYFDLVTRTMERISGQKPVLIKAKESISAFKVREGMIIGVKVTLRKNMMRHFLEKLLNITLPNVRDFQGINPKSVDERGNLSVGFKEHLAFPEISSEEVENIHGLEVCVTTTAKSREEGMELLKLMGFPFK